MAPSGEVFDLDTDGLRLAGERWQGDPRNDPVLLLHGGGQTRHSWQRTAARLASGGITTIALDARGHGDSDWHPDEDYSLDGFVGDLVNFVNTLDRTPVLVGASLGGTTALVAAGEHPGVASAVVLVDIVVNPEPTGVARITNFMTAHQDGFATLEEVANAIATYNPVRKRPRNLDGLRKNVRQRADGRWYWHWDPAFMRVEDEPQRRFDPTRLEAAAGRLTVPVMIVRGAQSDVVSDDAIEDMKRLIPHATTCDVRAAGHMVAGDDNDVFTANLSQFLASLSRDIDGQASAHGRA
ncbi:MAG TPA: alpha/beta hydrolase [Solirubrobacteraceae bacterium]|nr:alpha/beta hydrolase [Solirubrobacteraceae bacterium]HTX10481.1 alpha/beta hydrolase [Solirubrobacteraceae bacterium]